MLVPVLRPLSLGEVLDTSFGVYRNLFAPLVIVSAATQALPLVVGVITESAGGATQQPGLYALSIGLTLVLGAVGTAASTFLVAESYLGGSITWQEAFQRSTPFMGRLIGASMLTSFVSFLGALLFIIPGIILFCGLYLTTPAIVLEDIRGITDAMGRSWSLSKGHRFKIFAALFVAFLLIVLPSFALGVFSVVGSGGDADTGRVIGFIVVQSILQIMIVPFLYVLSTVLYYDLRVRKEGLDLEMLATSMHHQG